MQTNHIIYKGIQLAYTEEGKGEAIVFLHGFLENHTMWKHITPIVAQNKHVITVDLLGHGESECLGDVHTMDDMADALYAIITHLNLTNITLIGHSMGGYVALAFAENYPNITAKIILIASTTKADSPTRRINRDRAIALVDKNNTLFVSMAINNLFQPQTRSLIEQEISENISIALQTPLQGIKAALAGMKIRPDRESILFCANFPIYAIIGSHDSIIPYKETAIEFENTTHTVLEGGHMLHIENKEELTQAILNYLN